MQVQEFGPVMSRSAFQGGGAPPTLRFPPGPPLKPGLQHRRTTRKRQQPHMHFHPPRLHTSPPQPKSRPALKLDNVRLLKNFVSFTLTTAMINVRLICVHFFRTSSTAQGGGGSFKNRKPIGGVGCCESRLAEPSH